MSTTQVRPARVEYAAAEADVFPVDAHTTALAPSSTALEMARVMPRSLNDPVGLAPSTLSHTSAPTRSEGGGGGPRGGAPSLGVTPGVPASTGRNSRSPSITPPHPAVLPVPRRSPGAACPPGRPRRD